MNRERFAAWTVLGLGLLGGLALAKGRPSPETDLSRDLAPLVRAAAVARRDVRITVRAHGTVMPRTESDLVPEVSGRVVGISPALVAGGFFEAGETLLEVDPRDYESALRRADARLARTGSEAELARANLARLHALQGRGVASEAALDAAENAARVAEAARAEAAAARDDARRSLERTRLLAPYAGRVREERVDVGQFVSPGQPVARLYAVDYAEVRLPIRDAELAYLELPLDAGGGIEAAAEPTVVLRAVFAGAPREWTGRIVRTEGEIDSQSRMVHVVARVDDPYGRAEARGRAPLAVGLFVDAEIEGRELRDVISLPRAALRGDDRVFAVDAGGRLRLVPVEVVRAQGEEILVRASLEEGGLVCVSELPGATEGTRVRTLVEAAS